MTRIAAIGWATLGAVVSASVVLAIVLPRADTAPVGTKREAEATAAADGKIRMDAADQARAGLRIVALRSGSAPELRQGFARAIDVGALAGIDAEIETARAASGASGAELARLTALAAQDQSASQRAVEAARSVAAADRARLDLASRRVGLEFGPGLTRLDTRSRRALVSEIGRGRAALIRIDMPGAVQNGGRIRVVEGDLSSEIRVLGPAAGADPRLQSAGLLAVLRGPMARSAATGRVLQATQETASGVGGVILPREALVRWRGGVWAYRQIAPTTFVRTEVDGRPVADGWFTANGFSNGDRVVTAGSGTLLAIERGVAPADEED
ncbi:hypothetical protein [Phenylobacterium sp.]|uniref:hypothetical protein n=1 Tax=Phenylobacterium sp. TaxID=1871053 RepID=UPI0039835E27